MRFADSPGTMLRRATLWLAPLVLCITIFVPVTNRPMKAFQVALLVTTIVGWLITLQKRKTAFRVALALLIFATALVFSPDRGHYPRPTLPAAYSSALTRYDGVTYWWGGENGLGIDCSGLIRRAMIDATLKEGLLKLDGALLRAAADLWWHDCSAEALGEGYRGYTLPVAQEVSLNALDPAKVLPGDLAIAGGGAHILAYLGANRWIQADPHAKRVIQDTVPSSNGWYKGPVKIVRWRWLVSPLTYEKSASTTTTASY